MLPIIQRGHGMRAAICFAVVATALLSACIAPAPSFLKPDSPARGMVIIVMSNPEARPPDFLIYEPVKADNSRNIKLEITQNNSISGRSSLIDYVAQPSRCFSRDICVVFNLLEARYHLTGFGHKVGVTEKITYTLAQPMLPEGRYDPRDIYFNVPGSSVGLIGVYRWSFIPRKGVAALLPLLSDIHFARDPQGLNEKTILEILLADKEFRQHYPDWIPLVQGRLQGLGAVGVTQSAPAKAVTKPEGRKTVKK